MELNGTGAIRKRAGRDRDREPEIKRWDRERCSGRNDAQDEKS